MAFYNLLILFLFSLQITLIYGGCVCENANLCIDPKCEKYAETGDIKEFCSPACCVKCDTLDDQSTLIIILIVLAAVIFVGIILTNYVKRTRIRRQTESLRRRRLAQQNAQNNDIQIPPPIDIARGNILTPNNVVETGEPFKEDFAKPAYSLRSVSKIEYGDISGLEENELKHQKKEEALEDMHSPEMMISVGEISIRNDENNDGNGNFDRFDYKETHDSRRSSDSN